MLELCENHTGKMEGLKSLSTSVLLNPNCQKNRKILGSICSHCYAHNLAEMYSGLAERLVRNTEQLTKSILPIEELPDLTGETIFRLEAFGDLNNEIQLENYINIAKKNPTVQVTLYTKMYGLVYKYFKEHDVPDNFVLILSSLLINKKIDLTPMKETGKFRIGQLKSFTVYSGEFIRKNDIKINCGAKSCNKCRICYLRNEIEDVAEILKSDRDSTEMYLKLKDPKYVEEVADDIDAILKKWR